MTSVSGTTPVAELIASLTRNVADFPQPGVQFKDLTPLFADRDGAPPGDHRVPRGHRAERRGKAWAAAIRPGETRTRAPGRRAHR